MASFWWQAQKFVLNAEDQAELVARLRCHCLIDVLPAKALGEALEELLELDEFHTPVPPSPLSITKVTKTPALSSYVQVRRPLGAIEE